MSTKKSVKHEPQIKKQRPGRHSKSPQTQRELLSISEIASIHQKAVMTKPQLPKLLKWAENISTHPHLYSQSFEELKTYQYYRVVLETLQDIDVVSMRKNYFIQFSCSLYDVSAGNFVGKTYFSEMFDFQVRSRQRPFLDCQKSIFVYTAMENAVMKVDVWRLEAEKNKQGYDCMVKRDFIGYFQIDLTHSNETGRKTKALNREEQDRYFYEQIEEETSDILRPHSSPTKIIYQVMNTHSLSFLRIFVPPELICDQKDRILGLKNGRIDDEEAVSEQRSKMRFQVEQITFPRTIVKNICEQAEQIVKVKRQIVGKTTSNFKQFILHVEYHNGWKAVSQKVLTLKQKDNLETSAIMAVSKLAFQSKTSIKRSVKPKHSAKQSDTLSYCFEKMKQLNVVFLEEGGVCIIWLQTKVEVRFQVDTEEGKKQRHQNVYLPLAFALKSLDNIEEEKHQKFQLVQGNPFNLSHILQYLSSLKEERKVDPTIEKTKIYCELVFYLLKSKGGIDSIEKDTVEKDAQQIQSLKAEKQRLTRLHRKIKEEKRKRMIEINQQIPFLDPSKIKQELFKQKIGKIKSQKQEKEDILFFLKTKVNQLERQALVADYKGQDEGLGNSTLKLVQKLPEMFIDYKPEQMQQQKQDQIVLNTFDSSYYRKINKLPSTCEPSAIIDLTSTQTYINIRLLSFTPIRKEFKNYQILVYDYDGHCIRFGPLTQDYKVEDYKSMSIPIPKQNVAETTQIMNVLLNGFMPMYLQCENFNKMLGLTLIDMGQLIQKLNFQGVFSAQIQKRVVFRQQQNQLAEVDFAISFSQSYTQQKLDDITMNISQSIGNMITKNKEYNMISKINRYKQNRNLLEVNAQKQEVIEKGFMNLKCEKKKVRAVKGRSQTVKLNIVRPKQDKVLVVKVMDQDQKYLSKAEMNIVYKFSSKRVEGTWNMVNFKDKQTIQLKSSQEQCLLLEYLSNRKVLTSQKSVSMKHKNSYESLKEYNHNHKIQVTLLQKQTNVVYQMFQLEICPSSDPNSLQLEVFVQGSTQIILPFPCNGLSLQTDKADVKLLPLKAVVSVPQLDKSQWLLSQFTLCKTGSQNSKHVYQNIELYIWGSVRQEVEGRLWDQQDLLLKVEVDELLKRQIEYNYLIQTLTISSKHVDLKVRSGSMYSYQATQGFSKKSDSIFIRSKIYFSSVGQQLYPVEVSDQHGNVVYRIAVTTKITYPSVPPNQILSVKIPTHNLKQEQSFSYQNQSYCNKVFVTKALRPNLLQIKEDKFQMREKEGVNLSLNFNWVRIEEELEAEEKKECQLLLGVRSGQLIDYFLFRCRQK